MSALAPADDERYPAAVHSGGGVVFAAGRRASPSRSTAAIVPASAAAKRPRRERSPSPLDGRPPLMEPAPKKAKTAGEIKKEVQDLLEKNLMGAGDDAVKVAAMESLGAHFDGAGETPQERQQKMDYRRAVEEWNGGHVVLAALRRELDKAGGDGIPSRDVVHSALVFLCWWNTSPGRRDAMSRFLGVDAVTRAMHAFRNDSGIQHTAIACFGRFTVDDNAARCRELVEGNVISLIFRAIAAPVCKVRTRGWAVLLLGQLCDVAEPHRFDGLVEVGALEAVVKVVKAHMNLAEPRREKVLSACRKVMAKLIQ